MSTPVSIGIGIVIGCVVTIVGELAVLFWCGWFAVHAAPVM